MNNSSNYKNSSILSKKSLEFAYLRTELSSQNTYYSIMRAAFTIALVASYTRKWFILGFSILLLIGAYVQYYLLGELLVKIHKNENNTENIKANETDTEIETENYVYKLRNSNKYLIFYYSVLFILVIILEYFIKK